MSYLADVKQQLEDVFFDSFDRAWKDVIEPALKTSYANGVRDGRAGKGAPNDTGDAKPRRQWSPRRSRAEASGDD